MFSVKECAHVYLFIPALWSTEIALGFTCLNVSRAETRIGSLNILRNFLPTDDLHHFHHHRHVFPPSSRISATFKLVLPIAYHPLPQKLAQFSRPTNTKTRLLILLRGSQSSAAFERFQWDVSFYQVILPFVDVSRSISYKL